MLHHPFQRFPGEIQPLKFRIARLDLGDHAQGLGVVVKAAIIRHGVLKRVFAGMAKGRVSQIMGQRGASARSSSTSSARASVRAIWATSSEWVRRVR
jgi:hypothetical protein